MATQDRPFPWRCFKCLKKEVYPTAMPYQAKISHDGQLHILEIPALVIPKCRACGELDFDYAADEQVRQALRDHLGLLTSQQIHTGREMLGLPQKEFAKRLGVAE